MAWFSVSFLANNGGLMRFNIPSLFRGLCSQLRPYVILGLMLGLRLPAIALVGAEPNEAMWQGDAMRGGLVTDSLALPLAMRWEKQLEAPSPNHNYNDDLSISDFPPGCTGSSKRVRPCWATTPGLYR